MSNCAFWWLLFFLAEMSQEKKNIITKTKLPSNENTILFIIFCRGIVLKFQWSFLSRFQFFETSKNRFWGVLKLCETLRNFVKLCYWSFNKIHWNFMRFHIYWSFRTLLIDLPLNNCLIKSYLKSIYFTHTYFK